MSKFRAVLTLAYLCCLGIARSQDHGFDFFKFVLVWPQVACWDINKDWPTTTPKSTQCKLPNHSSWTIHGLWPAYFNGNGPENCKSYKPSELYYATDVRLGTAILPDLEAYWPTFRFKQPYIKTNNMNFWGYQYSKHGICSVKLPETDSTKKYFQKSIDLAKGYDVSEVFKQNGIIPGKEYDLVKLISALKDKWGAHIILQCTKTTGKNFQKQILHQIQICLDKNFKLIDCNQKSGKAKSCTADMKVLYQEPLPLGEAPPYKKGH